MWQYTIRFPQIQRHIGFNFNVFFKQSLNVFALIITETFIQLEFDYKSNSLGVYGPLKLSFVSSLLQNKSLVYVSCLYIAIQTFRFHYT